MRRMIPIVGLALGLTAAAAMAGPSCNTNSIKGSFGVRCTGHITDGPLAGPFAGVGRVECDGVDTCTITSGINSLGGLIVPISGAGPYTVNSDCTGEVTYVTPEADLHFAFVIVDHGRAVQGIQTDPGTAVTCELIAQ